MNLPEIDLAHNSFLKADNLPAFFMFALMIVIMIPQIPADYKGTIMIAGMFAFFPLIWGINIYGENQVAKVHTIKAFIAPYNKEVEFHVEKTLGKIQSTYNPRTGCFVTPFKLATPTTLPAEMKLPPVNEIEIEHKLEWESRVGQSKQWVHWKGIEVESPNVYPVELWYKAERSPKVGSSTDYLEFVPRFRLARGNKDYYLLDAEVFDESLLEQRA